MRGRGGEGRDMHFPARFSEDDLIETFRLELDMKRPELIGVAFEDLGNLSRLTLDNGALKTITVDRLGNILPKFAYPDRAFYVWPGYWADLKAEFRLLLCAGDPKYGALRVRLADPAGMSNSAILWEISASMADQIGVPARALVPFSALCLLAYLRLGKQGFCRQAPFDIPLKP